MSKSICTYLVVFLLSQVSMAESFHVIVPKSAGSGLDVTAREIGALLKKQSEVKNISFQNVPGGVGGRAILQVQKKSKRYKNIMIASTPIVISATQKIYPKTYHDLAPIASMIGDYAVFAVKKDSAITDWESLIAELNKGNNIKFSGGSVFGGMDHLFLAIAMENSGVSPNSLKYLSYDGGGKALASLLSGESDVISTGFSEVIHYQRQGAVRIIAVASPERLAQGEEILTLTEQGYPVVLLNWRGLFGAKEADNSEFSQSLAALVKSPAWASLLESRGWEDFYRGEQDFAKLLAEQEQSFTEVRKRMSLAR